MAGSTCRELVVHMALESIVKPSEKAIDRIAVEKGGQFTTLFNGPSLIAHSLLLFVVDNVDHVAWVKLKDFFQEAHKIF